MFHKEENTTTKAIHQQIKQIVAKEIEQLPELLEQLNAQERIKAVLQLLPFAAPKVENCETTYGEPDKWELD